MAADHLDIFEIYSRYCDIISKNDHANSREMLNILSKSLEARLQIRNAIFDDLSVLMSYLNLPVDSHQFNCFYDFVFFACRENGQKNITVGRAVTAWQLVLTGRFRLLNQWCKFVQDHQKHNISEDTWQQLLAFSRCVNEHLEGYDPKGAWPVLVDEFVEHMYRINQNNCNTRNSCCSCGNMETPFITNTFSGLNLFPGSKRKLVEDIDGHGDATPMSYESSAHSDHFIKPKKLKLMHCSKRYGRGDSYSDMGTTDGPIDPQGDMSRHNSRGCLQSSPSACAVEDCLSKGFEGHLSIGRCFQFDQKSRLSYT